MSDTEKIEIPSRLPVKDLEDMMLITANAFLHGSGFNAVVLANRVNAALEAKQAEILKGYDDEQITGI